jgi:hypothetical protein
VRGVRRLPPAVIGGAEWDLDLVVRHQGAVVHIAPVVGKKARAATENAGFKPFPMSMILVGGENRPGVCFTTARVLGDAGMSMDSVVAQATGKKYLALSHGRPRTIRLPRCSTRPWGLGATFF